MLFINYCLCSFLLYRFHFNLAKFYFRLNLKILFNWISHKDWYDEKFFYSVKFLKAPLFISIYYLVSFFFWLFFFRLVDLFSPCDFWFLLYDFLHDTIPEWCFIVWWLSIIWILIIYLSLSNKFAHLLFFIRSYPSDLENYFIGC
jgi:hypothetical protein